MTATVATSDAWMETCLVAICAIGGSDVQFASVTETIDMDLGAKDIDVKYIVNGGNVATWTPQGPATITFEAYPLVAGTVSGGSEYGFFDLLHPGTYSTQPFSATNNHTRTKYRVSMLWTDDTTATSGAGAIASSTRGIRIAVANGYFTDVKPSFTDGVLKFTVTFKAPAFSKAAGSNQKFDSTDGSEIIAALGSYTTSANW